MVIFNIYLFYSFEVLGQHTVICLKAGYCFLYKENKRQECILTVNTPPVYKDYLCTRTTCLQGLPVYKDHLRTRTTYSMYKDHLYTRTTCVQGTPVYKEHLCTRTTCVQGTPDHFAINIYYCVHVFQYISAFACLCMCVCITSTVSCAFSSLYLSSATLSLLSCSESLLTSSCK